MILPKRAKDLTGLKFGSLTAIRPSHKDERNLIHWVYLCNCGKEHTARANTVVYEYKRKGDPELPSCGCIELARKTKHGFRNADDTHPCYKLYRSIRNRCENFKLPEYKWYGAKGVTMCDEWKGDPAAFVEWAIANGYKEGLHIDKDILCKKLGIFPHVYSPETCKFVDAKTNVGFATNRDNHGSHPNVKLSYTQVEEILYKRIVLRETGPALAKEYDVTPSSIYRLERLAKV